MNDRGVNEGSDDVDEPSDLQAGIDLVRVIERTIHVSAIDTKREVDYVVKNPFDQDIGYILLPLRQFQRNLEVVDEDGQLINYFPNSEVERMLELAKEQDPERYQRVQYRFNHMDYKIYIQLPPEKPLQPGKMRTIRLNFDQEESVEYHDIREPSIFRGWISQWRRKLFDVPSFVADARRLPGHSHDVFFVVVGPSGYSAKGQSKFEGQEVPENDIYENGLDDDTRVMQIRLPEATRRPYKWDLQYDLVHNNNSLMFGLYLYWILALVLGVVFVVAPLLLSQGYAEIGKVGASAFITGTIGLIFALRPNSVWTDRYKILSVLPLLLHGIALIIWSSL